MTGAAAAPAADQGVVLHFRPDLGPLAAHLAALVATGDAAAWKEPLTEIGDYQLGEIQDNFDHQRLADGSPMPQSAAAIAREGKTLIEHRHLYGSYTRQVDGWDVDVGSDSVYARIHHFGGETGHPGHRFEMLARPVMGIGPEQEAYITSVLMETLRGLEPGGAA